MMDKKSMRLEVLSKRKTLSSKQLKEVSNGILNYLKQLDIWQVNQVVHIYLPIEEKNEINTWPIVRWLLENGHEVWVSHLPEGKATDGFCKISKTTQYEKDRFGAPLPLEKVSRNIKPSVVIVPCLAADKNGNRLGYGSGWYDKFLAKHPDSTTIVLAHQQFLFDKIPCEPHDRQLDITITEKTLLSRNKAL